MNMQNVSAIICRGISLISACRLKEVKSGELEVDVTWYSVLDKQPAH